MNSMFGKRHIAPLTILLAAAALAPDIRAQEEAPPEEPGSRLGNIYFHLESWVAQPVGLGYTPATFADGATLRPIETRHGTDDTVRSTLEYVLPSNAGTLELSLFSHDDAADVERLDPSNFVFGELVVHPLFAGVNNNGFADGFSAVTRTELREWRIDFSRPAFRSPRLHGDWFVGWRRVEHIRDLAADYFALVPGFPALLPPAGYCPIDDLTGVCKVDPRPDRATIGSSFDGRGLTAGMELEFPLWKNKLVLEGGVGISVLRGDMRTRYTTETHYYLLDLPDFDPSILGPPYDEFQLLLPPDAPGEDPTPFLDHITQVNLVGALRNESQSASSQVYDASLGFRWRTPLEMLEVFGGLRQSHYADAGLDLRFKNVTVTFDEFGFPIRNVQDLERTPRSVTYEGFYGGVRIRLY